MLDAKDRLLRVVATTGRCCCGRSQIGPEWASARTCRGSYPAAASLRHAASGSKNLNASSSLTSLFVGGLRIPTADAKFFLAEWK